MLSLTVVGVRLVQFVCAMILFGAPLFFLYGLPARGLGAAKALAWPRPFLLSAAIVSAFGATVALCAQTAVMSGSIWDAVSPGSVASVVTDTQWGLATAVRIGVAMVLAVLLAVVRPSRLLWIAASVLGAVIVASFAWTGHGSAGDGVERWIHLASDVLHLLAAAVWLGALAALAVLLLEARRPTSPEVLRVLHRALEGFSGVGSIVVATLLATGLVNSWYLIGPSHLAEVFGSPYAQLLAVQIVLFAAMLGLAAANRFHHTPRFGTTLDGGAATHHSTVSLRRSVLIESLLGISVLGLVSLLGTLAPLSSQ